MLVAGTVALDWIAELPGPPAPDTSLLANSIVERYGGCGANVAMALARLGHQPSLCSAVGADFQGSAYEQALTEAGIDLTTLVRVDDEPTARAFMANGPSGQQWIIYDEGATPAMDQLETQAAEVGHFAPGELSPYPRLMEAVDLVIFDPGQETFHRPLDALVPCIDATDILVCNHHEARAIAEHLGGLEELVARVEALVVSDAQGQDIHTPTGHHRVPGVPADPVDTTGAGDAHSAGIVHGLSRGWSLADACRMGSTLAAFAIETAGAQPGLPTLADALDRYEAAYGAPPART